MRSFDCAQDDKVWGEKRGRDGGRAEARPSESGGGTARRFIEAPLQEAGGLSNIDIEWRWKSAAGGT